MKIERIKGYAYLVICLFFCLGAVCFMISSVFEVNPFISLFVYFTLNLVAAVSLWIVSSKLHNRSFNPLSIFIAFNVFFYVIMPSLAAWYGYRFIDEHSPEPYFTRIVAANLFFLSLFSLGYIHAIQKRLFDSEVLTTNLVRTKKDKFIIFGSFVGAIIGSVSAGYLQIKIGAISSHEYGELTMMLSGQGWLLRLAELLGISGLLLLLIDRKGSKRLLVAGIIFLLVYVAFRIQFQNRENAIKYLVMYFIFKYGFSDKSKDWKSILAAVYISGFLILISLPIFSGLRAGHQLGEMSEFYPYFLFRDLNFSEISAAVLSNEQYENLVPITDVIKATFGMLIPRALWEGKPQALSVLITSLITPVASYDVDNPHFSYAPSYFSYFYITGGYWLIYLVALLGGYILGRTANAVRKSYKAKDSVTLLVGLIFVYYFSISGQKLDPANILTAMVIPVGYLFALNVISMLRMKK